MVHEPERRVILSDALVMIADWQLRADLIEMNMIDHCIEHCIGDQKNSQGSSKHLPVQAQAALKYLREHEQTFRYVVRVRKSATVVKYDHYHARINEIHAWTEDRFGPECPYRPETEKCQGAWTSLASVFMFKDKDNAFEFKVRWG